MGVEAVMTQEEVNALAKEAGMEWYEIGSDLKDFAELVALQEREACAAICDELHKARVGKDNYFAFAANAIRELRAKQ